MSESYPAPKNGAPNKKRRELTVVPGTPASERELRAQGRKTMRKLLDAGMRVFAERGYQAARVDDIVRAARTSHGTFYLYFANKEDLLRALAVECAHEMNALAEQLGAIGADESGVNELRRFLDGFFTTYGRYGPVIRAWMEGDIDDRETSALGVKAFTEIANSLARRLDEAGAPADDTSIAALMAMIERFAYFLTSRRLQFDDDVLLTTVTRVVHRGFFAAAASAAPPR
ncbi:MAG TPA: TetR/AcrR family transcriptional regulator [Acidimicrobiia bacterium]|nr:TetR/AcrR family transcriptional regulator [Acidimicrobiia bacterium]